MKNAFEKRNVLGPVAGIWVNEPSMPQCVLATLSGFDYVGIDYANPLVGMTREQVLGMIHAVRATDSDVAVLVRVPADPNVVSTMCQLGADGLVVSEVETAEQAFSLWKATKFKPLGLRRISGQEPANEFGLGSWIDPTLILQLKTAKAGLALNALMQVSDIDWWFVGPMDYTRHVPGMDTGEMDALFLMAQAVKQAGKKVGIMQLDPTAAKRLLNERVCDMVSLGTVFGALRDPLVKIVDVLSKNS